jgi:hypothetical protein
MFSSSGRDTRSWVHTEGQGKSRRLALHALHHAAASLAPTSWSRRKSRRLRQDESQYGAQHSPWALKARAIIHHQRRCPMARALRPQPQLLCSALVSRSFQKPCSYHLTWIWSRRPRVTWLSVSGLWARLWLLLPFPITRVNWLGMSP